MHSTSSVAFQHGSLPHAFQIPYFFDVVTNMIDVVTNSAKTTPTR